MRALLDTSVLLAVDVPTLDDDAAASYGRLAAVVAGIGRQPQSRVFDLLIAARPRTYSMRGSTLAMRRIWSD